MPSVTSGLISAQEVRSVLRWKLWHRPVHKHDLTKDNLNTQKCFYYLKKTSRSFVAVIRELHPDLLMPVCLCYLTLRGLDTIEDDTSISAKDKEPDLRNFDTVLEIDGWNFTKNRPEEKDRDLLVNFDCVIQEFKTLRQEYKNIIKDITHQMGNGMADYCLNADFNENGVDKIKDYDLYCYYVAGLLGEGSTRMFVESKLENPILLEQPQLMVSMGLFLQKINIIRDIREDFDDNRRYYPREIWSKHVDSFENLFKLEHREAALNCSSEMVLNALGHIPECLSYLARLMDQSVFNFCAIPQSMAIATLALCFRNPKIFETNVKIAKGEACQCMLEATQDLKSLCQVYNRYTGVIRKKNTPHDPNFLKINIACDKIEQFIESLFVTIDTQKNTTDIGSQKDLGFNTHLPAVINEKKIAKQDKSSEKETWSIPAAVSIIALVSAVLFIAYLFGVQFDFPQRHSNWSQRSLLHSTSPTITPRESLAPNSQPAHKEL